jgi:hypothetical protein
VKWQFDKMSGRQCHFYQKIIENEASNERQKMALHHFVNLPFWQKTKVKLDKVKS